MSKEVLLNKKSALELILSENIEQATDYKAQISVIDQELEDLGKPLATPEFLDKINETITEAVESIDLEDGISCDFELDYDNKVTISEARFDSTQEVADKIYCAVEKLFAEVSSDILEAQKADEACN
jgi:hypothetical protein